MLLWKEKTSGARAVDRSDSSLADRIGGGHPGNVQSKHQKGNAMRCKSGG